MSPSTSLSLRNDLRAVLTLEATAIFDLHDTTLDAMVEAARLIYGTAGPVICTGMGKSGHIARKAAATFVSTGQKSLWVHPSEASHGDMGLIPATSVILAISNSGETKELSDLLVYAERMGVYVIGITSNPDSTLARASRVCIAYGDVKEACPNGLAPTTSTTLALAICDALAVVLSKSINFTSADFRQWHPGGSLGARLRKVREVMHADFATVQPHHSMVEVAEAMGHGVLGTALVLGKHGLIGIITDGDVRRNIGSASWAQACHIMNKNPITIEEHETVDRAVELMNQKRVTSLVVQDMLGASVGVIHLHDALRVS